MPTAAGLPGDWRNSPYREGRRLSDENSDDDLANPVRIIDQRRKTACIAVRAAWAGAVIDSGGTPNRDIAVPTSPQLPLPPTATPTATAITTLPATSALTVVVIPDTATPTETLSATPLATATMTSTPISTPRFIPVNPPATAVPTHVPVQPLVPPFDEPSVPTVPHSKAKGRLRLRILVNRREDDQKGEIAPDEADRVPPARNRNLNFRCCPLTKRSPPHQLIEFARRIDGNPSVAIIRTSASCVPAASKCTSSD